MSASCERSLIHKIRLESLQNFKIKCVKCYWLILVIEFIEGNFRSFSIFQGREFSISSLSLEFHRSLHKNVQEEVSEASIEIKSTINYGMIEEILNNTQF